jgi:hypothetical protein
MDDVNEYALFCELFQQPGAYPYPFGSTSLGVLYELSDAELQRSRWPRLRDQAVAVDEVFAEYKGRYLAVRDLIRAEGARPALLAMQEHTVQVLRRIQGEQRRLRRLLDACKQPRWGVEWN